MRGVREHAEQRARCAWAEWPHGGLARGGLRSFGASDLGHVPRLGVTGSSSHHSAS